MKLFTHYINFLHNPVIEFENHDGKWFQLVSYVTKSGFGPHLVDIKPTIDDKRVLIEIIPNAEASLDAIGLFYSPSAYSYKITNPSLTFMECLAKYRREPNYHPRIGFYNVGAKIHKYYINYENRLSAYTWDLDPDCGWVCEDPISKSKVRFV